MRFKSDLITAGFPTISVDIPESLRNLESLSLLDYDEEGRWVARAPVYHFAQKKLVASGRVKKYLHGVADYIINLLSQPAPPEDVDNSVLLHARDLMRQCVEIQNWALLRRFTRAGIRQAVVRGSVNLWYRSNSVFPRFVSVDFHHATIADSSLSAARFTSCNFDGVTFTNLELLGAKFVSCNFDHTQLFQLDLRGSRFVSCNFDNSHLIKTDMRGVQFVECNFADCILADVEMQDTEFIECNGIEEILNVKST